MQNVQSGLSSNGVASAVGSGVSLCSADGEGEGTAAADGEGKALCAAVAAGDGAGETVPDAVQAQKTAAIINAAEKTQYAFNLFMLRVVSLFVLSLSLL